MPRLASINKNRYHQLIGLLALADRHYDRLSEIEKAVIDLTGAQSGDDVTDMIWGESTHNDAAELLKRLNITVED